MKNFTFLSREVCTFVRPHTQHLLLSFLCFFIALSPSWAQPSEQAIEVRLQPGQTATRQIAIGSQETTLTYETVIKETTASLARRNASNDGTTPTTDNARQTILYATGFEDYTEGQIDDQQGWRDRFIKYNTGFGPSQAFVRTDNPLNGEKHVTLGADDTRLTYYIISPRFEQPTRMFASYTLNINSAKPGSNFNFFTSEATESRTENGFIFTQTANWIRISGNGNLLVYDYSLGKRISTPYYIPKDAGYIEFKFVLNTITATYDLYMDGQRIVEGVQGSGNIIEYLEMGSNNSILRTAEGATMLVDDIKVIDGDAAAPLWVSTPVFSGTLPAQGQNTLDVAIDARNLAPGTYEANIQVVTPDFTSITTVPVTLIVEEPKPTVINKLNLTSMCSDNPEEELRWRIRNPNDFAVEVSWQVYGTPQQEVVMAPPGDSFFFTQTNEGPNTTIIRWKDEEGRNRQKVKASGKATCQPPQPELQLYPVPVQNELNITLKNADKGVVTIYNQNGEVVYQQDITANQTLNLKAVNLGLTPQQLYTVALQTEDNRVVQRVMVE